MATNIGLFDFDLPPGFIAQSSVEPRDSSKLMVLDRATGELEHRHFSDLLEFLRPDDVLVFNTSKVFRARLVAEGVELFVLKVGEGEIEGLLKPGKKFPVGSQVNLHGQAFEVVHKEPDGVVRFKSSLSSALMFEFCEQYGQVPIPPYVEASELAESGYQNVYAKQVGSVAAPTAGFHFTADLLERIKAFGVQIEEVILHVGIGTFRPVQTETLEEHIMHSEWVSIDAGVAERLNSAKHAGRRIIAVGTTTTRALEGVASLNAGELVPYAGEVNILISPGYKFQVIDGLITNFHLPKSTLLVLVSALAGRENVLAAYEEAKRFNYRFFSFGDAMLIV